MIMPLCFVFSIFEYPKIYAVFIIISFFLGVLFVYGINKLTISDYPELKIHIKKLIPDMLVVGLMFICLGVMVANLWIMHDLFA